MSHHVIEYDEGCKACGATGLYVGIAERDGAAVVCHVCKGTGCHHVKREYDDYFHRQPHPTAKRVHEVNPGIVVSAGDLFKADDFGGVPYEAWCADPTFPPGSENRRFTCPAWWCQSADRKKMPEWEECTCGNFSFCEHIRQKEQCWERWDKEQGADAPAGAAKENDNG